MTAKYGILTPEQLQEFQEIDRQAHVIAPEVSEWQWQHTKVKETRGLSNEAGRILAGMVVVDGGGIYYRSAAPMPAALVTSVGSAPEHRRKGYIRELFAGLYDECRSHNIYLSALYPFSFPFYRAFGYELAAETALHTVAIDQFYPWRHAGDTGTFVPATEADWQLFNDIYVQNARASMGYIPRSQTWWKLRTRNNRQPIPAYIYYDAAGEPVAYLIYHFQDRPDGARELIVRGIEARNREAYQALLGFLYNHDSQAETVRLRLPVDDLLTTQLPDPSKDEVKIIRGYMLRVLDIGGALRTRQFVPEAEGTFTMHIKDVNEVENNGTYRVQVRDGRAEVEISRDESAAQEAGLTLDNRTFAQLFSGYLSPQRAITIDHVHVNKEADLKAMQTIFSPVGQPASFMANEF